MRLCLMPFHRLPRRARFVTFRATMPMTWRTICDGSLERLRAIGIERVVAVDLTRPDFGIPVVKVVIPGLEWDRNHPSYAAGPRARQVSGHSE